MVYINSRGEIVDDTSPTPKNIFWKFVMFFVLFFKSLLGIEDSPKPKDNNLKRPNQRPNGGFFGGGGGGGNNGGPSNSNRRPFGPRGFKSITDLPPPPSPCAGGACGL